MNGPQHYMYAEALSNHANRLMNELADHEEGCPREAMEVVAYTSLASTALSQALVHAQLAEVAFMHDSTHNDRYEDQWDDATKMKTYSPDDQKFEDLIRDLKKI